MADWEDVTSSGRAGCSRSLEERLRSATRGDLVASSFATHFGSRAFAVAGPKAWNPAAGAFTDTRDSRPLQDGIKDLSVLHPVTVTNC